MQYFDTLPKLVVTDSSGHSRVVSDLLARASIISDLMNNPMMYYKYDIQDGDTPETIAYKYYGNSYRYWIVLFANQLLDPQWDWPLTSEVFEKYMNSKYPTINVYTEVHHYEKIITTLDSETNTETTEIIVIDEETYDSLVESNDSYTINRSNENLGSVNVTVNTTKKIVNIYDYEYELNESKRNINILNVRYVEQMESELTRLMSSTSYIESA